MFLTTHGTEWPVLCWCAVKQPHTHSLFLYSLSSLQSALEEYRRNGRRATIGHTASEMTYRVSGGSLNSTHSLTVCPEKTDPVHLMW